MNNNFNVKAKTIGTYIVAGNANLNVNNSSSSTHQRPPVVYVNALTVNHISSKDPVSEADIERFKKEIKEYYRKNATIKIPIFKTPQHVKDSYVNLAIVDNEQQNKHTHKELTNPLAFGRSGTLENENLALLGRNQTFEDINKVNNQIEIETLFDNHNRGVIIGRAGIGKSTFCKYIAYRWQTKDLLETEETPLWPKFTMIYWLPLRYFANYVFKYNEIDENELASFIAHVLPQLKDSSDNTPNHFRAKPAEICQQLINESQSTLLILDGYDEIKNFLNDNQPQQLRAKALFNFILNQYKHYVITSRPHAATKGTFPSVNDNAYYELMGFTNDNIPEYITKTFALLNQNKEDGAKLNASQAISTIIKNPCVWGVSHVPINLALICSVWDQGFIEEINTINMTQLYTAIITRIYKINLSKLWNHGQNEYHSHLDKRLHKDNDSQFKNMIERCKPLINFLEEIAFNGMIREQLIFSHEFIEEFLPESKHNEFYTLANKKMSLPSPAESDTSPTKSIMDFICSIGLTNALTDAANDDAYYFIHLTFQEYYAASHLKNLWLNPETHDKAVDHLKSFIDDSRYEVVIWFLAGHLFRETVKEKETVLGKEIDDFFKVLIPPERPNLSTNPTLLILLCRCLEEISLANVSVKDKILKEIRILFEQILFHTDIPGYEHLIYYRKTYIDALKFSPMLLGTLNYKEQLENLKNSQDAPIWATVAYSELYAEGPIGELIKIINNENKRIDVRKSAINMLVTLNDPLKIKSILPILIQYLSNEEDVLSEAAFSGLCLLQQDTHPDVIFALEKTLKIKDLSKERKLFCITKMIESKRVSKELLLHCFENTDDAFKNLLNKVLSDLKEQFITVCKLILRDEDKKSDETVYLKVAYALEAIDALDSNDLDINIHNKKCVKYIEEMISKNNLSTDIILKLLDKMIDQSIMHKNYKNLYVAIKMFLAHNTFTEKIMQGTNILLGLDRSSISHSDEHDLISEIKKKLLAEHSALSQHSDKFKPKEPGYYSGSGIPYTYEDPYQKVVAQIILDLNNPDICHEARKKASTLKKKYLEEIFEKCSSIMYETNITISQTVAEMFFEHKHINSYVIDTLIRNASLEINSVVEKNALKFVKKYAKKNSSSYQLFREGFFRNLNHDKDAVVSFSLSSLLEYREIFTETEEDDIRRCFEIRSDALDKYDEYRKLFDQLLLKSGTFIKEKERQRVLKKQLSSIKPSDRLSAAQTLLSLDNHHNFIDINIGQILLDMGDCLDDQIRMQALNILNTKNILTSANKDSIDHFINRLNDPNIKIAKSALKALSLLLSYNMNLTHLGECWEYKRLLTIEVIPEIVNYLYSQFLLFDANKHANQDKYYYIAIILHRYKKLSLTQVLQIMRHPIANNMKNIVLLFLNEFKDQLTAEPFSTFFLGSFIPHLSYYNEEVANIVKKSVLNARVNKVDESIAEILCLLVSTHHMTRAYNISKLVFVQDPVFLYEHLILFYRLFDSKYSDTIISVLSWMTKLENIPSLMIKPITYCLVNKDKNIRVNAFTALKKHNFLMTDECISTLFNMLKSNDATTRLHSYEILTSKISSSRLFAQYISYVCTSLRNCQNLVVVDIMNWLINEVDLPLPLPPEIFDTLLFCLESKSDLVRNTALSAIQHCDLLENHKFISRLESLILSDDPFIKKFATATLTQLNHISSLSSIAHEMPSQDITLRTWQTCKNAKNFKKNKGVINSRAGGVKNDVDNHQSLFNYKRVDIADDYLDIHFKLHADKPKDKFNKYLRNKEVNTDFKPVGHKTTLKAPNNVNPVLHTPNNAHFIHPNIHGTLNSLKSNAKKTNLMATCPAYIKLQKKGVITDRKHGILQSVRNFYNQDFHEYVTSYFLSCSTHIGLFATYFFIYQAHHNLFSNNNAYNHGERSASSYKYK